ncbi:MAG: hypothetical protein BMS9Abin12_2273 [Acidimicrobiia bacterium]|nr:MAG: hypothetical protein BMS9Abin12_2273 [Acidimicrobiia bacterium]
MIWTVAVVVAPLESVAVAVMIGWAESLPAVERNARIAFPAPSAPSMFDFQVTVTGSPSGSSTVAESDTYAPKSLWSGSQLATWAERWTGEMISIVGGVLSPATVVVVVDPATVVVVVPPAAVVVVAGVFVVVVGAAVVVVVAPGVVVEVPPGVVVVVASAPDVVVVPSLAVVVVVVVSAEVGEHAATTRTMAANSGFHMMMSPIAELASGYPTALVLVFGRI